MKDESFSFFGSNCNTVSITYLKYFCFFPDVMETLIESDTDGHDVGPLMISD